MKQGTPIAIIGIGCRFPGAKGVKEFWRIVRDGLETTADYPGGRFPWIDSAYAVADGIATRRGGFLPELEKFDAEFFGISPREAAELDPQQRLLLEVAWEAMEDAGIPERKLAGSRTGVFAGIWTSDYERALWEQAEGPDFYATTGGGRYSASGRVAFFLDLRGPNLTLDTACSSSLVSIHLACQSLHMEECEMALAGGANVILSPEITQIYSAAGMLSANGRSKFGDASADGYVRSEGAGLLLLKPLDAALADRDPIYAVIRGSSVNNDGRSSGLLVAPSSEGQEAMLRAAFRSADVDAGTIDYIEAHGTGTLVGDPVEIETIGRVVATPGRLRDCRIGSVKTNIGHTESAAGVAGVIKAALSLKYGVLPASLHFRDPNPAIAWDQLPVRVEPATMPWPHDGPLRLAGVSGFGITGTNAHVVLQNFEADGELVCPESVPEVHDRLFVLSAQSRVALSARAQSWLDELRANPDWPASLGDLAYTSTVRRTHLEYRLAIVAATRNELEEKLSGWCDGDEIEGVHEGRERASVGKVAFIYPGQGGQWRGMARDLMHEPAFRSSMEACDAAIRKHTGWSVVDELHSDESALREDVAVVQPCLFAVMVAMTALWRSWGVEPEAVAGHSMGESIAAWSCGALSLEDAAAVICVRSGLMKRTSGKGAMAVSALSMEDAAVLAEEYQGRLSLAAQNSPSSAVFSGTPEVIEEVIGMLTEREVFCRRIKVDVASHSSQMEPLRAELEAALSELQPHAGAIPLYSTTTGQVEDGAGLDSSYWSRNLRQPVLFDSSVQGLLRDGFHTFVEINAHPVLRQAVESGAEHAGIDAVVVASTRRDRNERAEMLSALGALHVSGVPVDFRHLYPEGECLRLPLYPWQKERHWIEVAATAKSRNASAAEVLFDSSDSYAIRWEKAQLSVEASGGGLWIVFGSGKSAVDVAAAIKASAHESLAVESLEELQRAVEVTGSLCRGVIRISGSSGADPREAAAEAWKIVETVRAITGVSSPARLWLVSSGLWSLIGNENVHVGQGVAWGLAKVIEREYAELRCVNVDLPAAPEAEDLQVLTGIVLAGVAEEVLAIRGGEIWRPRYERLETGDGTYSFRPDSAYLITGGLGGIGLRLARWMVQNGAQHIALVARRPPNESAQTEIDTLRAAGAEIRVFRADLALASECAAMLSAIQKEMPPLRGVFHLAAAYEPQLLGELRQDTLQAVMRSKADSAWHLDRHLTDSDLDFFVLFSSVAAAVSQPGLGAYAAANAYVEGLARDRRARGLPAQSIAWGSWATTGLSTHEAVARGVETYRHAGIEPVSTEAALASLGHIMRTEQSNILALRVAWDRFSQSYAGGSIPCIFEGLIPKQLEPPMPAEASIRGVLQSALPAQRRALLESHLTEKLAAVLKTRPERIDPTKPFGLMGLDSLMTLQFVKRLAATISLRLPAAVVFNYPTIEKLAGEVAKRMGIELEQEASPLLRADVEKKPSCDEHMALLEEDDVLAELMGRGRQ